MSKMMLVGDVHLSPRIPVSRKDDYPETLLNKLDSLRQLAIQNDVSDVIFLGDMFNTKHMTLSYFTKCFIKLKAFDDQGITLHTVVGNHDILYDNESTLEESPMMLLFESDIIDVRPVFTKEDTTVYLYNFTKPIEDITAPLKSEEYNILVGHYFYLTGFNDVHHTLTPTDCTNLKYNAYVLGHDHTPYSPVKLKGYEVHRPGSLSRGTSQTCHVNRDNIQVVLFDTKTHTFDYVNLPNVLPPSEVYKEDHLIDKVTLTSISESLQDLLADLTFDNSSDIYATLNQIPMNDKVRALIVSYLNAEGIYNKEEIQ